MTQPTEERIGELVTASNQLTSAVENKIGEIDQKMSDAHDDFELWLSHKDVEGELLEHGTVRTAIFQGYAYHTDETITTPAGYNDFAGKVPALGTAELVYLHFKVPLNVNENSEMFWFNIQGYSYGSAAIINEIIVGYCHNLTKNIISKSNFGTHSPNSYLDSSGNVILRILVPNIYYTTIKIDTMHVGNGRLFNKGDLDVKLSLIDTVEF